MPLPHRLRFFRSATGLATTALATLLSTVASAAEWQGTVSSRFSETSNWSGGAPQPNTHNVQAVDFRTVNESLNPLRYTAADGETIIGSSDGGTGQFIVGGLNIGRGNGSGLIYITGGILLVTSPNGTSFTADNGRASGILQLASAVRK